MTTTTERRTMRVPTDTASSGGQDSNLAHLRPPAEYLPGSLLPLLVDFDAFTSSLDKAQTHERYLAEPLRELEAETGYIVDPDTGEILDVEGLGYEGAEAPITDEIGVRIAPLSEADFGVRFAPSNRTPDRTPYVGTTGASSHDAGYRGFADAITDAIGGAA